MKFYRVAAVTALVIVLAAVPALAKDITITLNDDEQRAMVQLLNIANKATGLESAEAALHFMNKMKRAAEEAQKSTAPNTPAEPNK